MPTYSSPPTTDRLLTDASTSAGVRHRIKVNGAEIDLVVQMDRILAYRDEEDMPIAVLRFGGPHSGAIWIGERLVGEYEKDQEGQFVVTEIEAGFKRPTSRRQEDPVVHLINLVQHVKSSSGTTPQGGLAIADVP
jgi:hypothetical protein